MRVLTRPLAMLGLFVAGAAAERAITVTNGAEVLALATAQFAQLPHIEAEALDGHARQQPWYSAVAICELLSRVHAPLGDKPRGAALQDIVRIRSRDGCIVVFALAEFDQALSNREVFLADQEDGHPLRRTAAPFQLIVPGDQRPARRARMVTSIEVLSLPKP